ncbi:hypothetical protein BLIC30S_04378 [Bacillus licheniformis]
MTVLSKSEKIMKQTAHFGANNYHPLPIVISEAELRSIGSAGRLLLLWNFCQRGS